MRRSARKNGWLVLVLAVAALLPAVGCDDYGMGGWDSGIDPYNPYMTDAILDATAYQQSVYESSNQAWSDYIRGDGG